jgi:tripartite-type tricarboxylate transporter receptor subunit TctC
MKVLAAAAAVGFFSLGALLSADVAHAQAAYPTRAVKVIVPFPAGGSTDVIVRLVAQKLSASLGQQFYVENQTGAGGNIAMGQAASAPADGYTVLAVTNSFILNPSLYAKVPYDPIRDFAPLTMLATSPYVMVVHPPLPAQTVNEFVALVRASPGKFSYASAGLGTPSHLAAELFRAPLGLDLVHVPFGGGPPAVNAIIAGHTPVGFVALPTAAPQVKDGKLRALAVLSRTRSSLLPEVLTMTEAGFPDRDADIMSGMLVRAGTPGDIATRLQREMVAALASNDVKQRLATLGFEPVGNTAGEFAAWIGIELPRWRKVIRDISLPKVE